MAALVGESDSVDAWASIKAVGEEESVALFPNFRWGLRLVYHSVETRIHLPLHPGRTFVPGDPREAILQSLQVWTRQREELNRKRLEALSQTASSGNFCRTDRLNRKLEAHFLSVRTKLERTPSSPELDLNDPESGFAFASDGDQVRLWCNDWRDRRVTFRFQRST